MQTTHENGLSFEHSLDHHVEFFSKAGSLFVNKESFYEGEETALSLFQKCWIVNKELSFKLLLWLRDCRGGAGNRSAFRACLDWLNDNEEYDWVIANLEAIPKYGRFDDLRGLLKSTSTIKKSVAHYWVNEINSGNVLAAKWADRKDYQLQYAMKTNEAGLRKVLSNLRKNHIVEEKMSRNAFSEIEYHTVPSLAMARYSKAFGKKDETRFNEYKEKLVSGEETIHSELLFPHDCVLTALSGDTAIADAAFKALPNYLKGMNERIIVLCDTSRSMESKISSKSTIENIHISQGLALYCSEKIGDNNPFYRKFIGFQSEGEFKNWDGMSFSEAVHSNKVFDGAVGSTRIDLALKLILDSASMFRLPIDKMPTTLLIVSDMQFSHGCRSREPEIQTILKQWVNRGYNIPKIVYWNIAGYSGSPDTVNSTNVALISGFSPAILKAVFSGEDFSPRAVMLRALEKYEVLVP